MATIEKLEELRTVASGCKIMSAAIADNRHVEIASGAVSDTRAWIESEIGDLRKIGKLDKNAEKFIRAYIWNDTRLLAAKSCCCSLTWFNQVVVNACAQIDCAITDLKYGAVG